MNCATSERFNLFGAETSYDFICNQIDQSFNITCFPYELQTLKPMSVNGHLRNNNTVFEELEVLIHVGFHVFKMADP
jgi:hypothetical protein